MKKNIVNAILVMFIASVLVLSPQIDAASKPSVEVATEEIQAGVDPEEFLKFCRAALGTQAVRMFTRDNGVLACEVRP